MLLIIITGNVKINDEIYASLKTCNMVGTSDASLTLEPTYYLRLRPVRVKQEEKSKCRDTGVGRNISKDAEPV